MEVEKFIEHCKDVAKLSSKNKGHYDNLVFSQKRNDRAVIQKGQN